MTFLNAADSISLPNNVSWDLDGDVNPCENATQMVGVGLGHLLLREAKVMTKLQKHSLGKKKRALGEKKKPNAVFFFLMQWLITVFKMKLMEQRRRDARPSQTTDPWGSLLLPWLSLGGALHIFLHLPIHVCTNLPAPRAPTKKRADLWMSQPRLIQRAVSRKDWKRKLSKR